MHGMENISECDIRMFAMDLVGALDAQVQRRRTVRGIRDADVVVVADFYGLGIA